MPGRGTWKIFIKLMKIWWRILDHWISFMLMMGGYMFPVYASHPIKYSIIGYARPGIPIDAKTFWISKWNSRFIANQITSNIYLIYSQHNETGQWKKKNYFFHIYFIIIYPVNFRVKYKNILFWIIAYLLSVLTINFSQVGIESDLFLLGVQHCGGWHTQEGIDSSRVIGR